MVRAVLSVHDRSEPPSGPILGNRPRRAHPGHAPYPDARTIWRAPTKIGATEMKDCAKLCHACEKTCLAMVQAMGGHKQSSGE